MTAGSAPAFEPVSVLELAPYVDPATATAADVVVNALIASNQMAAS